MEEGIDRVQMLFSHLHTDHLFGFPFFAPVFQPGCRIEIGLPAYSAEECKERLQRYLNGSFHPLRLRELVATLEFVAARPNVSRVFSSGWEVASLRLLHPGGALGYRATHQGRAIAYLTDTGPFSAPGEGLLAGESPGPAETRLVSFVEGCDLVIFDTMFDRPTSERRLHWGHAHPEYAIAVCRAAGVRRLVLFHHAPDASDDDLDARIQKYQAVPGIEISQAREGQTLAV